MDELTITDNFLREQLLGRRQRLESAISQSTDSASLLQLLEEVDSALRRMDNGSYGICEFCQEPIEKERLIADPLVRYCIDHLTADQRRALEQDLDLASKIQSRLLPEQSLTLGGWELFYHYRAVGPVSGDYCDVVTRQTDGGSLLFSLGDAVGKGVAASMLMAQLHAIFRTLAAASLPTSELVDRANRVLCESMICSYAATLVCGKADFAGGIEICNAGHCPALLVQGGRVASLEATGLPLGIFREGHYSARKVRLAAGDSLFLYTDGLSEARNRADAEYGAARLSELVGKSRTLAPQALVEACLQDLAAFLSGAPLGDDLTVMAIRRVQ